MELEHLGQQGLEMVASPQDLVVEVEQLIRAMDLVVLAMVQVVLLSSLTQLDKYLKT
jgi:hypothetical protein|tara:strand:+ start:1749 stop:1919 length:171 start_codon:yes stop_codon:yes gene_type:complete